MKPIRFTSHAESALVDRDIARSEVELAIRNPDRREAVRPPREVVSRAYSDRVTSSQMLLRVFIEESLSEISVVTLYKTSKLKKYLPEANI
jgi:hypothetical protein